MTTPLRNWAGNHVYRFQRLAEPGSVAELREVVRGARKVRVVGTRHSFNDSCDSEDLLVDVARLASLPVVDAERGVVSVSLGTRFADVATAVHRAGWALPNMGSLPHISLVGAVSTGTHGSGVDNQVLGAAVTRMQILRGDGSTVELAGDEPELRGAVTSLGALGVVTEVDVRLTPSYELVQSLDVSRSWAAVRAEVPQLLASAYSVSIFTRWRADEAAEVLVKRRVRPGDGDRHRADGPPVTSVLLGDGVNLTVRDRVVPWLEALPHFRIDHEPSFGDEIQSEFFVPSEVAAEAIEVVESLADDIRPHLILSEIRAVAADDLWLSPAYGRSSTCLHFTWRPHQAEVEVLTRRLQERLVPLGARPHWGKVFDPDLVPLADLYPRSGDFAELAARLDPDRKFTNRYVERCLSPWPVRP